MKTTSTCARLGGILLCLLPLLAPAQHGPFAQKQKLLTAGPPISLPNLNATVIDGRRTAAGGRALVSPSLVLQPMRLPASFAPNAGNAQVPGLEVHTARETGLPIFIRGTVPGSAGGRVGMPNSPTQASLAYLTALKGVMRITDPVAEFVPQPLEADPLPGQTHQRLRQAYRGVPVYGAEVVVHSQQGQPNAVSGRYYATPALTDLTPALTSQRAAAAAIAHVRTRTSYQPISAQIQQLLGMDAEPESRLEIYHPDGPGLSLPRLVWHVTVRPNVLEYWEYFVDAKTGVVVHHFNHTCSADGPRLASAADLNGASRAVNSFQVGSTYFMVDATRPMFSATSSKMPDGPVGGIWTVDANNTKRTEADFKVGQVSSPSNAWSNRSAVSAHHNAAVSYEYFYSVHKRNSIDGRGGTVISIVNVADEQGKGLDNAFWNGKAMFYGNGDVGFKPLAGALDVGGHELSHGVIGNTANMEYQNQPGAINESFADVFGVLIEGRNWTLGEDVTLRSYIPTGVLRNMADPHNGGTRLGDRGFQPKVMTELYVGDQDNGGVHINSGIPNYAFYLFANAAAVGRDKAGKVYYRALTQYLTTKSQFIDLRLAVVQAATDLHGATSPEVTAAKTAFDAVGIFEGGRSDDPVVLPDNPGADVLLVHDASRTDVNSWYTASPTGGNLLKRSQTRAKRRASVTDNGSVAYYVGADSRIRALTLTGTGTETIVSNDRVWDNVAISKDGKRLAAITTRVDTSIYVFDTGTSRWQKFRLYNPTTAEGVQSGGVLYADALEWDYTGENLIYDAYNVITKDGDDINYWDVGYLNVWNNASNRFASGKIEKIFTSLPEGVSIGNPSLSKKSASVVAFDLFNSTTDVYVVIAADLQVGDVQAVTGTANNRTLGYPSFSKNDDRMAYTSLNPANDTIVATIPLKADRITPNGTSTTILREAKWVTWFGQGTRVVLSSVKVLTQFAFQGLTPAAVGTITGTSVVVTVPAGTDRSRLVANFASSALTTVRVGTTPQVSGTSANDFTRPVVYQVLAQDGSVQNYTVTVNVAGGGSGPVTSTGPGTPDSGPVVVYPNPNEGRFQLRWERVPTNPLTIEVWNATGQRLFTQTMSTDRRSTALEVNLPGVPPGLYVLRVRDGQRSEGRRLVVR